MRIALGLPSRIVSASGDLILHWATRADRGPFSSLVVTDRVVSQGLELLMVLAVAAGATRRIRLMTSVVIGPTRETTLLARQAATLDALSAGRLTLGVGIGVRENDYLATGFNFHRRGANGWKSNYRSCAVSGRAKWCRKRLARSVRHRHGPLGRNCSLAAMCRQWCGA
jgi:alkanesulfonate monooxygenase SsuD/methylene tetrahydromethanopterin reductase-like flavin-dependent oxidoreductase (luciferase family)